MKLKTSAGTDEPKTSNCEISDTRQSLIIENEFVKEVINTIPSCYYFDQDTKDQLSESKHAATDIKINQSGLKRRKEMRADIKNKFSKLDPEQNKTVTELISQLHDEDENKKNSNRQNMLGQPTTVESLQKRFYDKMKDIQKKKIQGVPDADLTESQLARRMKRKLSRQRARDKKKQAAQQSKAKTNNFHPKSRNPPNATNSGTKKVTEKPKPIFNKDGNMVFSKFDFADENKKKKSGGKDYKGLLDKVTKVRQKVKDIAKADVAKAKEIEKKQAWKSALQKSEGVKVKDDPELLKKAMKKKDQKKRKSEKQWKKREEHVNKLKSDKQTKRRENVQKRITDKKSKKIKKAIKKGRIIPGFS